MAMLCTLILVSTALASEVITVKNAQGGTYSILAYNSASREYYSLNGALSSSSFAINVPKGYSSSLSVALGTRVGTRNLYAEHDPLNPIFDVTIKSSSALEFTRIGTAASSKAMGAFVPNAALGVFTGSDNEFKRQSPQ